NEDDACDLETEDVNHDGACDVLDCRGEHGAMGPERDHGDVGSQGDSGAPGSQGPKGDVGDSGLQGPKGDNGDGGAQGPKGNDGSQGPKGDTGSKGDEVFPYATLCRSNEDDACDLETEDVNHDGACDVLDCRGAAGT